jgi:hypothetical protein
MKTNVPIELDDEQLSRLADLIDGKHTKRKATRKEIVDTAQRCFRAILTVRERPDGQAPTAGNDWFDEYLAETCSGAVFGEAS